MWRRDTIHRCVGPISMVAEMDIKQSPKTCTYVYEVFLEGPWSWFVRKKRSGSRLAVGEARSESNVNSKIWKRKVVIQTEVGRKQQVQRPCGAWRGSGGSMVHRRQGGWRTGSLPYSFPLRGGLCCEPRLQRQIDTFQKFSWNEKYTKQHTHKYMCTEVSWNNA